MCMKHLERHWTGVFNLQNLQKTLKIGKLDEFPTTYTLKHAIGMSCNNLSIHEVESDARNVTPPVALSKNY